MTLVGCLIGLFLMFNGGLRYGGCGDTRGWIGVSLILGLMLCALVLMRMVGDDWHMDFGN